MVGSTTQVGLTQALGLKMRFIALCVIVLASCSEARLPPATYAGYYETDDFEYGTFRPMSAPNERWWIEESLPCAFLDFNQEPNKPWRRVFVKIQGEPSTLGKYGHLGSYQRKLHVAHMVSCRPLHEDERVEP